MEASSPLAALHRPMLAPAWPDRDIFRSHPHTHFSRTTSGTSSVSLREQLQRGSTDYFDAKEVRGSSPAASLAADLSQNFRLDADSSPHFPTPRRALFTTNMMSGMERHYEVTTPPLQSSPGGTELMEMSPLPHKVPSCSLLEVGSPTPVSISPDEDMALDSPAPISRQCSVEGPKPVTTDRKIAAPRRPSLTRMKGFTTSAIPSRVQGEATLPPFRFGTDSKLSSMGSNLSLGECFESASPPQDRTGSDFSNSPCGPVSMGARFKTQLASAGSFGSSRHGSPLNYHARRQSNPFLRNRKQFRRSLSMFEHPADIMKPKSEGEELPPSALKSVMAIEEAHEPGLPHFLPNDPADTIPRISKQTLLGVLDGEYADQFEQKMIIDCRFEYEYDGGHIEGAVNYNDKELLTSQLFQTPMNGRTLLIFHCEYSAHRAPLMARHIRSEDRTANAEHYPKLTYPEVYILDGGYSGFFAEHRQRCYPPEYVEMSDEKHQRTCEREMGRLKSRKGLSRAQTFAFGQREPCINDSPTGPSRPTIRHTSNTLIGHSPVLGDLSQARRMASY